METFLTILVVGAVIGFIVFKSETVKSKVHKWTKPKSPGNSEQK